MPVISFFLAVLLVLLSSVRFSLWFFSWLRYQLLDFKNFHALSNLKFSTGKHFHIADYYLVCNLASVPCNIGFFHLVKDKRCKVFLLLAFFHFTGGIYHQFNNPAVMQKSYVALLVWYLFWLFYKLRRSKSAIRAR
jgi:hypothetical protein